MVIFVFAALAAIIVGLVAPAGRLAIMALGVLGVMIVNFVDSGLGQDDETSQTGSAARRKKTPAPETD